MKFGLFDQRILGAAVLERFAGVTVTGDLATSLESFRLVHGALEGAAEAVDEARRARDAALAEIGAADTLLDRGLDGLATKLVGAGLGSRKNPFSSYSSHAPSELVILAYKTEVAAVREMAARIAAKGPNEEVTRAIGECLQHAAKVEQAVTGLSGPQSTYDIKRAARDAAAMDWSKAYSKLRLRAELAFEDDRATFDALFTEVERVQRPVKRRKKSKADSESDVPE